MIAAVPHPETEKALELTILSVLEGLNQRFPRDTKHVQFIAFTNRECQLINNVASRFFFPKRPERGFVVGDRLCFRSNRRHQNVTVSNGQISSVIKITNDRPGSKKRGRDALRRVMNSPRASTNGLFTLIRAMFCHGASFVQRRLLDTPSRFIGHKAQRHRLLSF